MGYPVIQEACNAGVISPTLAGQNEIEPRTRGLEDSLNFLARVEGGLFFRGGTKLVATVRDSEQTGRLFPFVFSMDQAYVIDVEPKSFRFVCGDGLIAKALEDADAWTSETEYAVDDYVANDDALYRCIKEHDSDHEPGTASDWGDYWETWGDGDPYELTNDLSETNVAELNKSQSADVFFMADGEHPLRTLSRYDHDRWEYADVETDDGPYLTVNTDDKHFLQLSAKTGKAVTVTATGDGNEPFAKTDVGRHVRMRHGTAEDGYTVGWGVINTYTSATKVKIEVKQDFGGTAKTDHWWLGAWSETTGYPHNVGFINQSLAACCTDEETQTVYKSNAIDIYNFGPTNEEAEVTDDCGFSKTIGGSDQINRIHSFAWSQYLVLFTAGGVWRYVTTAGEGVTADSGDFRLDNSVQVADIDPVRIGPMTICVDKYGKKIYGLKYEFATDALAEKELSRLSGTLFEPGIKEIAYQYAPAPYIWCLLKDGTLVCMVHVDTEDVTGCFPVRLAGGSGGDAEVESIAVIPGSDRDELYLRVKRTLNGTVVRTIERMTTGYTPYDSDQSEEAILERQKDCFFVDCGMTYEGDATDTVSGLDMFEGETVRILADGAVHPERVVEDGRITLQYTAKKIHVGLGYEGYFAPARREFQTYRGSSHGKHKRLKKASLLVRETLGVQYGASLDALQPYSFGKTNRTLGKPIPLVSGVIDLRSGGKPSLTCPDLYIHHDSPTPCEVQRIDRFIDVEEK